MLHDVTANISNSAAGDAASAGLVVAVQGLRHEIAGRVVLDLPQWSVGRGEHSLILGPSGSGKTTLLFILAGLLVPTAGRIAIAGKAFTELAPAERDAVRGRAIGLIFQTLHLVSALSVADNLRLARLAAGLPADEDRVAELLRGLDIADKAGAYPRQLSHGEAQRVAIARAVVNQPRLILADEPTSALDDANCMQVLDLLCDQAAACEATLLIATHDGRIRPRFERGLQLSKPT